MSYKNQIGVFFILASSLGLSACVKGFEAQNLSSTLSSDSASLSDPASGQDPTTGSGPAAEITPTPVPSTMPNPPPVMTPAPEPTTSYVFPASAASTSGVAITTVPTYNNLSLYWKPAEGATTRTALVRYRVQGTTNYSRAHDLWFDAREASAMGNQTARSKEYRGSIVGLKSGTTYEIEIFLTGINMLARTTATTLSDNFKIAKTVTVNSGSSMLTITEGGSASTGYVLYTGPAGTTLDAQNAQTYNIDIRAPYVIVRGLTLKGAKMHSIRIAPNTSDVVIENNDISGWGRIDSSGFGYDRDAAVATDNLSSTGLRRITIQNNKMHHPRSNSNNWTQSHNGNLHPMGPQSVSFNKTDGQLVIRYNQVYSDANHYFNDCIGGGDNFSYTSGFPGPDSDIYGNTISHCWDDAIESEGTNQNVRIADNFIDLSYVAHGVSTTGIGPLYVYRNITHRLQNNPSASMTSGYWYKSQGKSAYGGRAYVYHNTMLLSMGEGISDVGAILSNTISRNNILRSRAAVRDRSGDPQTSCDYDLIDGGISTVNANHEKNAVYAVPQFDSAPVNQRGLVLGSPGQDKGAILIPNFNDNFKGAAPDMGAIEK